MRGNDTLALETFGWIDPVLAVLHPIDPIALRVEVHSMDIDLETGGVGEHERVGR